jgi:hypothetical protein
MLMLLVQLGADVHYLFKHLTAFAFACREFYRRSKISRDDLRIPETLLDLGSNTDQPVMWAHYEPNNWSHIPVTALRLAVRKDDLGLASLLLQFNVRSSI